jgi:hypothetical protein
MGWMGWGSYLKSVLHTALSYVFLLQELRNLKAQNMDLHRAQQEANIKLERCKKGIDEISARKQEILHNKQK